MIEERGQAGLQRGKNVGRQLGKQGRFPAVLVLQVVGVCARLLRSLAERVPPFVLPGDDRTLAGQGVQQGNLARVKPGLLHVGGAERIEGLPPGEGGRKREQVEERGDARVLAQRRLAGDRHPVLAAYRTDERAICAGLGRGEGNLLLTGAVKQKTLDAAQRMADLGLR